MAITTASVLSALTWGIRTPSGNLALNFLQLTVTILCFFFILAALKTYDQQRDYNTVLQESWLDIGGRALLMYAIVYFITWTSLLLGRA